MKQEKVDGISPIGTTKKLISLAKYELKEWFINNENSLKWTKITLIVFYILEFAGTIAQSAIKIYWLNKIIDRDYNYHYDGHLSIWLAANWLALVYHLVYSVIGMIGVIKESQNMMYTWTCLGVVAIVSHGLLYSWLSSILVSFTTVLTAIYAVLIYAKERTHSSDKQTDNVKNVEENVHPHIISQIMKN